MMAFYTVDELTTVSSKILVFYYFFILYIPFLYGQSARFSYRSLLSDLPARGGVDELGKNRAKPPQD
jgi:hypothetical protein